MAWKPGAETAELLSFAAELVSESVDARRRAISAVGRVSAKVEQTMVAEVPRLTGETAESIHTTIVDGGYAAETGPTTPQGFLVEVGTAKMAPNNYATRSLEAHRQEFYDEMAKASRL